MSTVQIFLRRPWRRGLWVWVILSLLVLVGRTPMVSAAKQELLLYYNEGGLAEKVLKDVVQEFNKAHPGVNVRTESVLAAGGGAGWIDQIVLRIATNTNVPDVYLMEKNKALILIGQGQIMPLDSLLQKDKDRIKVDDIVPGALREGYYNGQIYGIPARVDPQLIFANMSLLSQAGFDLPRNDWTLNEFRDIARKLTKDTNGDGVVDVWGCDISSQRWAFPAWLSQFGGALIDPKTGKVVVDQPEAVAALNWLCDLIHGLKVAPPLERTVSFAQGNVGLWAHYAWQMINLRETARCDWDILPLPRGPAGPGNIILGNIYMIDKNSKNKDLAWELVKYLVSPETQRKFAEQAGNLFARRSFFATGVYRSSKERPYPQNWLGLLAAYEATVSYPSVVKLDDVRRCLNEQVEKAIKGQIPPVQALENAAKAIRAVLGG